MGRQEEESYAWTNSTLSVGVTVALLAWFAIIVRGRMPRGFRDLQVYALRYGAQSWAYLLLLTDRYPDANPEEPRPVEAAAAAPGARSS